MTENPQERSAYGTVDLDERTVERIQAGILNYTYRGLPMLKCPFDIALYMQLIWDLRPKTVLEFGSKAGGSALWLADLLNTFGLNDTILRSYDKRPVTGLSDQRVEFLKVDVSRPQDFIDTADLDRLPRPLLAIDDASHQYADVSILLDFLHPHLLPGDYLIVEDGIVDRLGFSSRYDGGPLRALKTFLERNKDFYEVDRSRCDTFGRNVTWNVEGYIRRIA